MTDRKEIKRYFGVDLIALNLLPVYVNAKNESSSSFVVSREWVSLETGPSISAENPGGTQVRSQAQRAGSQAEAGATGFLVLAAITMPIGLIVFMPAINKMSSDASEITYHFATNELQMGTLSPGETAEGFVYFDLPESQDMPPQWPIHLKAHDLKSGESREFDFLFTWTKDGNQT